MNELMLHSATAAAAHIGIPRRTFQSYLDGRSPSMENLEKICEGLNLECYIGPPRLTSKAADSGTVDDGCISHDAIAVSLWPISLVDLAGGVSPNNCMWFTASYMERRSLDPLSLLAIKILDDSMAPTLTCGAVIVDTRRRKLQSGRLFGLSVEGEQPIVRTCELIDGRWHFVCDNPAYQSRIFQKGMRVLGAVVWGARGYEDGDRTPRDIRDRA